MKLGYYLLKHLALVYLGQSDVYVKQVSARALLVQSFLEDESEIVVTKCLLEKLFACGIDALTDKYRSLAYLNGICV